MKAASDAFPIWRDSTPSERQRALLKIADAIEARGQEFVDIESENCGKPKGSNDIRRNASHGGSDPILCRRCS